MQTDATSHYIVACCWGFLANNVASVCTGLKVWPKSNYTQQVPTSANIVVVPCKTDATCWAQECCVLLSNNVASVCMGLKAWSKSNYTQQVPTSANTVVVPCERTPNVGPKNVACCWPTMLRPFAWVFTFLSLTILHFVHSLQIFSFSVTTLSCVKIIVMGVPGLTPFKALLHCAFFSATCLAMVENVALQVAEV